MTRNEHIPQVHIILLNWCGAEDTIQCLDSLMTLNPHPTKIWVVDNGSPDESVARIRQAYPNIPIIETGRNLGFSGGVNVGLRQALRDHPDYIWLLNNDTVVDSSALGAMLAIAEMQPETGGVGSVLYSMDDREQVQAWGGGWVDFWTGRSHHFHESVPAERLDYLTAASILIRREAIEDIGLFDERTFFMYWEDTDFCFRLRKHGWQLAVAQDAVVYHREGASTGKGSSIRDYYVMQSATRFFRRYAPVPMWSITICTLGRAVKRMVQRNPSSIGALLRGVRSGMGGTAT